MSRKPPARKKRKRHEITRSQVSGISTLSDSTCTTEEVHDSDERSSQSSKQSFNFGIKCAHCANLTKSPQHIMVDTPINPSNNTKQRRLSWCQCQENDQTFVKQISNQSDILKDNAFRTDQHIFQQFTGMEAAGRTAGIPHVHSAPTRCQCEKIMSSRFPENNCTLHEKHEIVAHLMKQIKMQQETIDSLTKDRINANKHSHRLSVSVTSLGEMQRGRAFPIRENALGISETHRFRKNSPRRFEDDMVPNVNVFNNPYEHSRRVNQRRSRSCDLLLNEEENQTLIATPCACMNQTEVSSGYEDVDEFTDRFRQGGNDNRTNCRNLVDNVYKPDIEPQGRTVNRTNDANLGDNISRTDGISLVDDESRTGNRNYNTCRYNFRKMFNILLAVNTLIAVSAIAIVYMAMIGDNHEPEPPMILCLDCKNMSVWDTVIQQKNGQCCFKSLEQLFEVLSNTTSKCPECPKSSEMKDINTTKSTQQKYTAMVQYKARKTETVGDSTRIAWNAEDADLSIQKMFGKLSSKNNNTMISIPESGIYYIYSRVHYKKSHGISENFLKFGYTVLHIRKDNETTLNSAEDTCFPSTPTVRHTSHLSFMYKLNKDDNLYVKLDNDKYFDARHTMIGLFLLQADV